MRAASLPLLALPLLLSDCGAKDALVIGEIASVTEAGTASGTGGSTGAEPTGGSLPAVGAAGSGGAVAGSSEGGSPDVGGTTGLAGSSGVDCVDSELPPLDSLIHRYSFDGTGTAAIDSISALDGTVEGGPMLDGSGILMLEGDDGDFVDLPDGIVSSLTDLTIVAWITWDSGAAYQRIFDFGISDAGEGKHSSGRSYIAMLPKTGFEDQAKPGLGAEIKAPGFSTVTLASTEDVGKRFVQVAFVFRSGINAELYLDATLLAEKTTDISLSDIDDRNNWLGQSEYKDDPAFNGSYEELRIYSVALNVCQLHNVLVRGYDML